MTRTIRYSGIQRASDRNFDSRQFATFWKPGILPPPNTLSIEPSLSLRQTHLLRRLYRIGGSGLGLTVGTDHWIQWGFEPWRRPQASVLSDASHSIAMNASVAWEHELGETHDALSAHFAETSGRQRFHDRGTPRNRDAAAIGLKVAFAANKPRIIRQLYGHAGFGKPVQKLFGGARFKW